MPEEELLGCGVYVNGITHDLTFERNTVRDTREGDAALQHTGFRFTAGVTGTRLVQNEVSGHGARDLVDETGEGLSL